MLTIKEHETINQLIEEYLYSEGNSERCNEIADELIKMHPDYNPGYLLKLYLVSKTDDNIALKNVLDQLINKNSFNLSIQYPYELLQSEDPEKVSIFNDFLRSRSEYLISSLDITLNKTLFQKELFEIYDNLKDGDKLVDITKELIMKDYNFLYIQRHFLGKDKEPHREKMNKYFKQDYNSMCEWNNTPEEKIEVFTKVFSEVKFNSASLKVSNIDDWDSHAFSYIPALMKAENKLEFYELLAEMVHKVGDNHNRLSFPEDIEKQFYNPGLRLICIKDKFYVRYDLDYKGVKISAGDELIKINNKGTDIYIDENKSKYPLVKYYHFLPKLSAYYIMGNDLLTFKKDSKLKADFRKADNTVYSVEFSVDPDIEKKASNDDANHSKITSKMLEGDIMLIDIPAFWGGDVYADFIENITKYDSSKIKGIIFDVRRNAGGNSGFGDRIFSHFTTEEVKNYFMTYTKVHIPMHSLDGIDDIKLFDHVLIKPSQDLKFSCPVAVLTTPYTGSAAEGFVFLFKYYKRGKIIGLPTAGGTGNPLFSLLRGGGYLRVNLNVSMFYTCKGIEPDVFVDNTIDDLIKRSDSQLDKAIEYLRT